MTTPPPAHTGPCPAPRSKVLDLYFLDHRAKVLDIAAYLDRLDRAKDDGDDFRIEAFQLVIDILADGNGDRARRVLEMLSDHSTEPIDSAEGMKGAHGAPTPSEGSPPTA